MADDAGKISDVQRKIDLQRQLMNGKIKMRQASDNPQVQAQLDTSINDGRKAISYLENALRELQSRMRSMSVEQNGRAAAPRSSRQSQPLPMLPGTIQTGGSGRGGYGDPAYPGYSDASTDQGMPARGPFSPPAPGSPSSKTRPNYSKLGTLQHPRCSAFQIVLTWFTRSNQT